MPASLGSTTTTKFHYGPEMGKLHIEFAVAVGQTVHAADPVILAALGTVQAAAASATKQTIIGLSIHDGVAGELVTVAVKGYVVVLGEAGAAALNAGPVMLGVWNATTNRREYLVAAGADAQVINTLTVGSCLAPVALDGDAIMVLLFH